MNKRGVITFVDYKVNRIEFKNNDEYEGGEVDIDFDVSSYCHISDDGEEMIVGLNIDIFTPKEGKVYPFSMIVEIEGYFKSNIENKEQDIRQYEKNAVAILFPYIRALVSTFTANANVTPLILPTVNVNKMLDER
ncbi:MAG: hypothetical protein HFH74_07125 [Lachnospiraceae bacterium]|jgi:preprotein translocase subunit SecB|nr:hypothetical protein [Lachnospiraceae bacterium]